MENLEELIENFNVQEKLDLLIPQFTDSQRLLNDFKHELESLIRKLIDKQENNIHDFTGRVKDITSLNKKISKKGYKYNSLTDITDLVGIRIITHFEDYVDKVAEIIESEFKIDLKASIDKRKKDYDKFGYQSLHYVISFKDERTNLSEYKRFKDLKAEIQIRSLLQHGWAEMEHDIGYKSQEGIPMVAKRSFSRIAALLETADIEFIRLRDELTQYKEELTDKITFEPENVEIDFSSLTNYIEKSTLVKEIDNNILDGKPYNQDEIFIEQTYLRLKYVEIHSIKDIQDSILNFRDELIEFGRLIHDNEKNHSPRFKGMSIFYLPYLLTLSTNDYDTVLEFFENFFDKSSAHGMANYLFKFYDAVFKE